MIRSVFIINGASEVLLEKHWGSFSCRAALECFQDHISKSQSPHEVPVVLETTREILINVFKDGLFYLAVCIGEINPLMVIEFLSCFHTVITNYFGNASMATVRENIVCVYEVLDEMLDSGFPVMTEPNVLMEMVKPGNIMKLITDAVTGKTSHLSPELPTAQLSNVRWRRAGIRYTNNEVYFDVIERINAIIDKSGNTTLKELYGCIECYAKLSGNPDLVVAISSGSAIDDASLHPSVRFLRWQNERVLSFVPPDGRFCLMKYRTSGQHLSTFPFNVRHHFVFGEQNGSFDLVVTFGIIEASKADSLKLTLLMPACTTNVAAVQNMGRVRFDPGSKRFEWDVGRLDSKQPHPSLKGTVTFTPGSGAAAQHPPILLEFSVPRQVTSGLKISRVDMYSEKYKLFKGVRYVTKSGSFEIRT